MFPGHVRDDWRAAQNYNSNASGKAGAGNSKVLLFRLRGRQTLRKQAPECSLQSTWAGMRFTTSANQAGFIIEGTFFHRNQLSSRWATHGVVQFVFLSLAVILKAACGLPARAFRAIPGGTFIYKLWFAPGPADCGRIERAMEFYTVRFRE